MMQEMISLFFLKLRWRPCKALVITTTAMAQIGWVMYIPTQTAKPPLFHNQEHL